MPSNISDTLRERDPNTKTGEETFEGEKCDWSSLPTKLFCEVERPPTYSSYNLFTCMVHSKIKFLCRCPSSLSLSYFISQNYVGLNLGEEHDQGRGHLKSLQVIALTGQTLRSS